MILNVVLFLLIIVLTVAVALWFTIDYKARKKRAKNLFYGNAKATPAPTAIHKRKIKEAADNGGN